MRRNGSSSVLLAVVLTFILHTSNAFHTTFTKSLSYPKIGNHNAVSISPKNTRNNDLTILHTYKNDNNNNNNKEQKNQGFSLQKFDRVFDTMKTAGFENYSMQMSPKRFLLIFVGMVAFKYIRAKKLKQSFMEKQPAWGHVITSKDEEKNLHAWTCKECGSTMFIAKGREIRFFNPIVGIECQDCGAKGKDSFYDRREEIAAEDDTDFEYENPLDYISNEERKKLMKKKKADEKKKSGSLDADVISVSATSSESENEEQQSDSGSSSSSSNSEKKAKGSGDSGDPLGMDL